MNPKKFDPTKFSLTDLLLLIVLLAFLALPTFSTHAQGISTYQTGAPNFYKDDTIATPVTLTNGQSVYWPQNGTNSLEQTIRQDHGLSVFVTVISSNSLGGLGTLGWDVASDGTAYTTSQPLKFTFPTANYLNNATQAGATLATNVYWTNWPATVVNNFRSLQLTSATNALIGGGPATNSVTVKVRYSYSVNAP